MRWIVHPGLGKTGSSAIQGVLNYHRERLLREEGLLYPNLDGSSFEEGDCHNHSRFLLRPVEEQVERLLACLDFAEARGLRGVVFSSETDTPRYREVVGRVMAARRGRVRGEVVVYVRRQDHLLEATWKEWGQLDAARDFEEFLNRHFPVCPGGGRVIAPGSRVNVRQRVEAWEREVGREAIRLRVYERGQLRGGDVVVDFLDGLGVRDPEGFGPAPESRKTRNVGFRPAALEWMRLVCGGAGTVRVNRIKELLYNALDEGGKKKPFEAYPYLSPAVRREILEGVEADNRHLARRFLCREDGVLFREPWPREEATWSPPVVEEAELCELAFRMAAHLLFTREEIRKEWKGIRWNS